MVKNVIWEDDLTSMEQLPFIKSEYFLHPASGNIPIEFLYHNFTNCILEDTDKLMTKTNDYSHEVLFHQTRKSNIFASVSERRLQKKNSCYF